MVRVAWGEGSRRSIVGGDVRKGTGGFWSLTDRSENLGPEKSGRLDPGRSRELTGPTGSRGFVSCRAQGTGRGDVGVEGGDPVGQSPGPGDRERPPVEKGGTEPLYGGGISLTVCAHVCVCVK